MTNQEIITAVEEWVEENEELVDTLDEGSNSEYITMVEVPSLILFIKKLLHE